MELTKEDYKYVAEIVFEFNNINGNIGNEPEFMFAFYNLLNQEGFPSEKIRDSVIDEIDSKGFHAWTELESNLECDLQVFIDWYKDQDTVEDLLCYLYYDKDIKGKDAQIKALTDLFIKYIPIEFLKDFLDNLISSIYDYSYWGYLQRARNTTYRGSSGEALTLETDGFYIEDDDLDKCVKYEGEVDYYFYVTRYGEELIISTKDDDRYLSMFSDRTQEILRSYDLYKYACDED